MAGEHLKRLVAVSPLVVALALAGAASAVPVDGEPMAPLTPPATDTAPDPSGIPARVDSGPVPPEIPVALLIDMATGQTLFERDADRRFVPASVTKVMTAYTAFQMVEAGKLPLDRVLVITPQLEKDWWNEGSTMFLKAGDRVTVGQLLLGITTVSANDASVALALEAVGSLDAWLAQMNANARELGLRNTHFGTPNGWPDEGRTFTSARDLATLGEAMVLRYPGLYHQYFGHSGMTYRNIAQANHDPVTGVVDGADGIKTGFTRQAGYNFIGSAERGGRRLMMVIAGAPTARVRDAAARELLRWGFDAFETRTLLPASTRVGEAQVQDGAAHGVGLATEGPVIASLMQGGAAPTMSIRYRGPVEAPIAKGQRVAFLRVQDGDGPPHDVPLVATEAVPRANMWQRMVNGLTGPFS